MRLLRRTWKHLLNSKAEFKIPSCRPEGVGSGSSRTSKTCYLSPYCFTWWEARCASTITLLSLPTFSKNRTVPNSFSALSFRSLGWWRLLVWQMWGGRDSCCARQSFDGNKFGFSSDCEHNITLHTKEYYRQHRTRRTSTLRSDKWSYTFSSANQTRHIHTFTGLSLAHLFLKWGC